MQLQRNNLLALCLLISMSLCSCTSTEEQIGEPQHTLELSASVGGMGVIFDTIPVIYIATTLFNPGNDTIRFLSMSCSYEDFFTTNSNKFQIQSPYNCYHNVPVRFALPPRARTDRYIMIRPPTNEVNDPPDSLRIGMYFLPIKATDTTNTISLYQHRMEGEIVWSDGLDLKRLNKTVY